MCHDVVRYLFRGNGRESERKGWYEFGKDDFTRCQLPPLWNTCVDHLGDGKKIVFPVMARLVLHWGPKSYEKNPEWAIGNVASLL